MLSNGEKGKTTERTHYIEEADFYKKKNEKAF